MRQILFGIKYVLNYWLSDKKKPLICGLVLHNICNLRCRHCTVIDRDPSKMSYDEAKGVIDLFYAKGGRCLYLEGGEPYIWKDGSRSKEDVVKYAHSKGYFSVIIYTNGTQPLCTDADTVFVSIDGLRETHDTLRGKSFDKIIANIQDSNHPSIFINYTINSINKTDITDFCSYIATIPQIKGIFFYFHTPYYGYDELYLDYSARKEIMLQLMELKKKYKILNSRAGLKTAIRNNWKKRLSICSVYENGKYYNCCRENNKTELCADCGYLSYAEIEQTLRLKPGAIFNALKYF